MNSILKERRQRMQEPLKITLAAARVNAGMTQKDVCKIMKITPQTLVKWEKNKKLPKPAELMMLCTIYGIDLDNIFLPS